MPNLEKELINELNVYSGLDSFNSTVIEKELEQCAELGADAEKLKALKFNALQLAEIRKGLTDKVDISKYEVSKYIINSVSKGCEFNLESKNTIQENNESIIY